MAQNSSIEWTDATWNPVTECDRISSGCDHCYALTWAKRLKAMSAAQIPERRQPGNVRCRVRCHHSLVVFGGTATLAVTPDGLRQLDE